jgi:hypothetical protein
VLADLPASATPDGSLGSVSGSADDIPGDNGPVGARTLCTVPSSAPGTIDLASGTPASGDGLTTADPVLATADPSLATTRSPALLAFPDDEGGLVAESGPLGSGPAGISRIPLGGETGAARIVARSTWPTPVPDGVSSGAIGPNPLRPPPLPSVGPKRTNGASGLAIWAAMAASGRTSTGTPFGAGRNAAADAVAVSAPGRGSRDRSHLDRSHSERVHGCSDVIGIGT